MTSIGVRIRFLAAPPAAAPDGRCSSRPMPGRGLVSPARPFPLFLIFTMALTALNGRRRTKGVLIMDPVNPNSNFDPGARSGDPHPSHVSWQPPPAGPLPPAVPPDDASATLDDPYEEWFATMGDEEISAATLPAMTLSHNASQGGMPIAQPAYRTGMASLDEATGGLQGITFLAGPEYAGPALALVMAHRALAQNPRLCCLCITPSLVLDPLLLPRGLGIPVSRRRSRQVHESEEDPWLAANTCEFGDRFLLTASVGPDPADPDALPRPFVHDRRNRLVQSTRATGCLIVIDEFASIGVHRGSATSSSGAYWADYTYDPARLNWLDWLRRMTGDPLLVVAGIRKQTKTGWPHQVRGTSPIVESAACVAFLEPKSALDPMGWDNQRLTLHVTKARYGRPADISLDLDVLRFDFTEVTDSPDKAQTSPKRRSA